VNPTQPKRSRLRLDLKSYERLRQQGAGPVAQQVQEFVRWSHAQTIVDAPVSVNPRSFSSWQFTVPPGALMSASPVSSAQPSAARAMVMTVVMTVGKIVTLPSKPMC
jgi:hypothetical protein